MTSYKHESITTTPHLPVFCSIYESNKQLTPSHWHDYVEILMPLAGTLYITLHDQEYTLEKNEIFIINANDIHSTKSTKYVKMFLLQIPSSYLSIFIPEFSLIHFQESFEDKKYRNSAAYINMQQKLEGLSILFENKEHAYEFNFMAMLHQFFHILYLHFTEKLTLREREPKHISRLKDVLLYINEHYTEQLSLQKASDMAALNPEYFCRAFKRCTGTTFLEYTNLVRLTHIYQELFSTSDSVTDILERNGFTNYKVFSRMFKENYGSTPAALRNKEAHTKR